jgi:hypothetical protein
MATAHDFVGQTRMLIDMDGGSPFARCVIRKDADPQEIIKLIRAEVRAAFERHCLHVEFSSDRIDKQLLDLRYLSKPEEIRPKAVEDAAWEQCRKELGESMNKHSEERVAAFANNPDNGKHGYWEVDGVRHSGFVLASSEAEAVQKAIENGVVGDWEAPTASYVGERPETMR